MSCESHCKVTDGFLHFSEIRKPYDEAKEECWQKYQGQLAAVKEVEEWQELKETCCNSTTAIDTVESVREYFMGINFCPFGGYSWEGDAAVCKDTPLVESYEFLTYDCAKVLVKPDKFMSNGFPSARVVECDDAQDNYYICQSAEYIEPIFPTTPQPDETEFAAASSVVLIGIIVALAFLIFIGLLIFAFRKKLASACGCESHKSYQLKDQKEKQDCPDESLKLGVHPDDQFDFVVCNTQAKTAATPLHHTTP